MEVRAGDRFRVVRQVQLHDLVHWRAPLTSGFDCILMPPTVLVVDGDPTSGATATYCIGEDPSLEATIVPGADRYAEKYDGYSLVVDLDLFGDALQLIPS